MDLLAGIRTLLAQRAEHAVAIEQIDRDLNEARKTLGVIPSDAMAQQLSVRPVSRRGRGPRQLPSEIGATQQRILEALAESQPQTIKMLEIAVPGTTTVALQTASLHRMGRIVRARENGRNSYWFALNQSVLDEWKAKGGFVDPRLPRRITSNTVAAGTTAGAATTRIAECSVVTDDYGENWNDESTQVGSMAVADDHRVGDR